MTPPGEVAGARKATGGVVGRNALANIAGRAWSAIMGFAFVPAYIRLLGLEAYGLIGFSVSLLALFFFLDLGLSTAINRDLAQLSRRDGFEPEARRLTRTLELIYWPLGLAIGGGIIAAAPWLAEHWLNPAQLGRNETVFAVRLIGVVAIFRWPVPLYSGALMGLQRQASLNAVLALAATVQWGGAAMILWLVSPTIHAFFLWQAFSSLLQIAGLWLLIWRALGREAARFDGALLRGIARFSIGIASITVLSVLLTQFDKMLLSRLLPLDAFGLYSVAGSIAAVFTIVASAVYGAVFPAISRLVAQGDEPAIGRLYHTAAQALSVLLFPAGWTIILFADPLLQLFVGKAARVAGSPTVLQLLVFGNLLLGIMLLPLALQLANGWTRLSLVKNVIAVALFLPAMWLMATRYGAIGAASIWVLLTTGYVLFEVPVMHARLLRTDKWSWYGADVAAPAGAAFIGAAMVRLLAGSGHAPLVELTAAAVAGLLALGLAIMASSRVRPLVMTRFNFAGMTAA